MKLFKWIVVLGIFCGVQAHAKGGNRSNHMVGIILGIATPSPTLVGGNLGINLGDWSRITAGYGSISATTLDSSLNETKLTATTIGGTFNLFVPGWNFSPTAGIGYAQVDVTVTGTASTTAEVGGFSASGSHTYANVGFDWTTGGGFHLAFGYNHSLKSGVGGLPYFNLGWFF